MPRRDPGTMKYKNGGRDFRRLAATASIHTSLIFSDSGGKQLRSEFLYHTPLGYVSSKKLWGKKEIMKEKPSEISKEKQKLFSRIKRLGGQIGAVERAVTDGDECADILMLLAAIRGGVNSLMAEILEDHIRLHITHPERGPDSPEELTEDLISLVRAYLK
jgi:DNA-binding FrmR family transcriptional regulator